jgi:transketolase
MRNAFANAFYEMARQDERLYLVVADITASAGVATFTQEFPDRFINVGVSEQIMIGLAAGLALRGCIPFTYTIAPFTIYRPFEQVRVDCCYHNLPVRLVGVGAGVTYSTLGSTHHALEDLAVMSAIPNMTVLVPCDPAEAAEITRSTSQIPGPVYLRLGKVGEPDLTAQAPDPFQLGKIRFLKTGRDLCFLATGPITQMACELAARLKSGPGLDCAVVSVHSIKPLDRAGLVERVLQVYDRVVVIEEHVPHGGLSSRVKELAQDAGVRTKIQAFTLRDAFLHQYGSHTEVLRAHGLAPDLIYAQLV